jgi:hypothetical protein
MTYTTLTFNGTEQSLGDWGIGRWRREAFNQASDSFGFDLISLVDAAVNGGNVACHPLTIKLKLINQATGPYGFANGGIDFLGVNALGSTFNVGAVNASQ